jgi:hypothetical protein
MEYGPGTIRHGGWGMMTTDYDIGLGGAHLNHPHNRVLGLLNSALDDLHVAITRQAMCRELVRNIRDCLREAEELMQRYPEYFGSHYAGHPQ